MSTEFDVSPAQLRQHARAVEEVVTAVGGQRSSVGRCYANEGGFGVFFGWMAGRFNRSTEELVDALNTQAQLLEGYATGLRDTASDFELLEAAVARLFAIREGQ